MSIRFIDIAGISRAANTSGRISPNAHLRGAIHAGLLVMGIALAAGTASAQSSQREQRQAFTAVDAGVFDFQSNTSALLNGDGFQKQGGGLNTMVGSTGQFDLLGPASKCANGFTGRLVGGFVEPNVTDSFSYTIDNQLCPTAVPGVYSASGTYKITGGTGKYARVSGAGLFEGLADFGPAAKYKCLLFGVISY